MFSRVEHEIRRYSLSASEDVATQRVMELITGSDDCLLQLNDYEVLKENWERKV